MRIYAKHDPVSMAKSSFGRFKSALEAHRAGLHAIEQPEGDKMMLLATVEPYRARVEIEFPDEKLALIDDLCNQFGIKMSMQAGPMLPGPARSEL